MKIRDSFAVTGGDNTEYDLPNGLEIIADDGRTLFSITLIADGIEVSSGAFSKHGGKMLDQTLTIVPKSRSLIQIKRDEYV